MIGDTSQVSFLKLLPLCITIFAVFVIVDRAVSACLKRVLLASNYRYMRIYKSEPVAKYVVLGNSRAAAHFCHSTHDEPQEFFNLGQGGMRLPIGDALIRDYIATHGKPFQVIIETLFLADEGSGIGIARLAQIYSTRVRHMMWQEDPDSARISAWFNTLQFNHNMFITSLIGLFWERDSRFYRGQISQEVIQEVNSWEPFSLAISERNAQVLIDLLTYLKAQNIDVIMVMTPLLPERIRKINNLPAFLDNVQALADATEVRFFNFIDHVLEHRYFADSLHLNQQGLAIFLRDFWRRVGVPGTYGRTFGSHAMDPPADRLPVPHCG
jgi:hypothetical protein